MMLVNKATPQANAGGIGAIECNKFAIHLARKSTQFRTDNRTRFFVEHLALSQEGESVFLRACDNFNFA